MSPAWCGAPDEEVPVNDPSWTLSPLHAELDPVDGGRFVDAEGREVMLSGIDLKSLCEYWRFDPDVAPDVAPVFPLEEMDADRFADIGWNVVLYRNIGPGQIWTARATATNWSLEIEF